MRRNIFVAVASGKDTEIVDSERLKEIKFACETLPVTSAAFGCEYRSIPEIGADIVVYRVADMEPSVGSDAYEFRRFGSLRVLSGAS